MEASSQDHNANIQPEDLRGLCRSLHRTVRDSLGATQKSRGQGYFQRLSLRQQMHPWHHLRYLSLTSWNIKRLYIVLGFRNSHGDNGQRPDDRFRIRQNCQQVREIFFVVVVTVIMLLELPVHYFVNCWKRKQVTPAAERGLFFSNLAILDPHNWTTLAQLLL